jgi:hypothetical protein
VVGDEIEMDTEKAGQAKKYRPCKEYHYKPAEEDPLDMQIFNSTRGHEIVHPVREAVIFWKDQWKKARGVTKNIEVVDIGKLAA